MLFKFKRRNKIKNNLILTHIQVLNATDPTKVKRVIRDPRILEKWASKLEVQQISVLFEGQLALNQKEDLISLLSLGESEFKTKNCKNKPDAHSLVH